MPLFSQRIPALASGPLMLFAIACAGEAQTPQGAPPPPEVLVETVNPVAATVSVILPGRTTAYRVAQLRPQVSGLIIEREFEEGETVRAGQPLYRIDSAPYEAAYQSALATLARAEALAAAAESRAKRTAELVKTNAVSRQDHDDALAAAAQARAEIAAARAARDSAKVDLDRTTIVAPIDGRIGRALITDGALVTANQVQELAVIHALDPIYVDVVQSSAEILRWKRRLESGALATVDGDTLGVELTLEDGSAYGRKGKIALTEVSVDPSSGSVTLRAVFPNPDGLLLPGMFVRAEIVEGVRTDAILAPQRAISRSPQGEGVAYVIDAENRAQQRIVETERAMGDKWVIAGGLKTGDRIVVEGFQRFRPGDTVTPVDVARLAAASAGDPTDAVGRVR